MISFKNFLLESEGLYDDMVNSIESRLRQHHELRAPDEPFSLENVKKRNTHSVLLDSTPSRSRMETADFSMTNHDKPFTMYKFYVPREGRPTAPHHVAINFRQHPEAVSLANDKPITSVSFDIDGYESKKALPDFSLDKHKAIYSGLMDAISHHAIETGNDVFNYHFQPVVDTESKTSINPKYQKAKSRRYETIARLLTQRSGR
jgi:hypothetical protein